MSREIEVNKGFYQTQLSKQTMDNGHILETKWDTKNWRTSWEVDGSQWAPTGAKQLLHKNSTFLFHQGFSLLVSHQLPILQPEYHSK